MQAVSNVTCKVTCREADICSVQGEQVGTFHL